MVTRVRRSSPGPHLRLRPTRTLSETPRPHHGRGSGRCRRCGRTRRAHTCLQTRPEGGFAQAPTARQLLVDHTPEEPRGCTDATTCVQTSSLSRDRQHRTGRGAPWDDEHIPATRAPGGATAISSRVQKPEVRPADPGSGAGRGFGLSLLRGGCGSLVCVSGVRVLRAIHALAVGTCACCAASSNPVCHGFVLSGYWVAWRQVEQGPVLGRLGGRASSRLSQASGASRRGRREGAQETHADEPLQRSPDMARRRARGSRRRCRVRLWLARRHFRRRRARRIASAQLGELPLICRQTE